MKQTEFVTGMAMLMSLVALSIDAMLPALATIGASLNVTNPNDPQLIVSTLFLGMAFGMMFYGPYSDSFGRKKAIYIGGVIFVIGCLVSIFSTNFPTMLVGRFLQGFGAAATRVVSMALIRDKFEGRQMAKIVSLIMIVFIMVPAIAPTLGQLVLMVAEWRSIFGLLLALALVSLTWLWLRLPETLTPENRRVFSIKIIRLGAVETLKNPITIGYTLASGCIFAAFIGYLSSAQQILQIQYKLGDQFALYFGSLALAIGIASFLNSKFVVQWGMERLCLISLIIMSISSGVFLTYCVRLSSQPDLSVLVAYLMLTFFCAGVLFGNFNALAMAPLGHIAGIGNSVISSLQTFLSVGLGFYIGYRYDGTVIPLVSGFCIMAIVALLLTWGTARISREQ